MSANDEDCFETALHHATKYHHIHVVAEMLRIGEDVRRKDRQGQTPLHLAVLNKSHLDLVSEMIPNGHMPSIMDFYGLRSMDIALRGRDEQWIKNFATNQDALVSNGFSKSLVKMLLAAGADVNARDDYDRMPLQSAVYTGDLELLEILLEAGADVNNQNNMGTTALHDAVLCGNESMVFALLKSGAAVGLKTFDEGETALHWATALNRNKSHRRIIEMLLRSGGDVNHPNLAFSKRIPFEHILTFGDIDLIKLCIDRYGANLARITHLGHCTMMFAVHNEDPSVINLLLEAGVSRSPNGITALHYACRLIKTEYVQMLIQKGADVNATDNNGSTPLLYVMAGEVPAVYLVDRPDLEEAKAPLVRLLLKSGADPYQKVGLEQTFTALELALYGFIPVHPEVRNVIVEHTLVIEAGFEDYVFDEKSLEVMGSHPVVGPHYLKCRRELMAMMERKIKGTHVTYFSVISAPLDVVARYAKNEQVVEEFKGRDFSEDYPVYASRLTDKYNAAVDRRERNERAYATLSESLPITDPKHLIIEKICEYLDDEEIELLANYV
ncbi:putative ankyrin repeat protein RF_0381 [Nasonia vitripennis]|uniref:Ankyrin repeat protein n=1 Tax=Nasonia vitripennis TaxID=7425 RepID=A0A7M7M1Y9_NASVI|nr:putative ankyrin repeat protein RF_0381 [Nasonia vitripennis]